MRDVLTKMENDFPEGSISGRLKQLEVYLLDEFKVQVSYKTLETYKKKLIDENTNYNVKTEILNVLSRHLQYKDYTDFCLKNEQQNIINLETEEEKESFYHINNGQNTTINILSKPNIILSQLMEKRNKIGALGILCILGFVMNQLFSKKNEDYSTLGFMQQSTPCMIWDSDHYRTIDCQEDTENAVPYEKVKFEKFRKINNIDTITTASAGGLFYSKEGNNLEIFTHDGKHPQNGKHLKPLSKYMINKYITN